MTIETTNNKVVTDFLLEVSEASSYNSLMKAYKVISADFQAIIKNDTQDQFNKVIKRYLELEKEAKTILTNQANGNIPTADQRAIFGEMIILRDFCLNRNNKPQ